MLDTMWKDSFYIQIQKLLEIVHFDYLVCTLHFALCTLEKGIWLSLFPSLVFIFYDIDNEQYSIHVWFCNLLENVIQIKSKENNYRHFHWNIFSRFLFLFISWFVCLIVWFIYVLQICGYLLWFITTSTSSELRWILFYLSRFFFSFAFILF